MKNIIKALEIIAFVAIMVFGFSACETGNPTDNHIDLVLSGIITIVPTEAFIGTELTATYTGIENITIYQWEKDGVNIGTNSDKYIPHKAGVYTVTVTAKGYKSKRSTPVIVNSKVATPVAALPEGTYTSTQYVTLSTNTDGAYIFYTLDGTTPSVNSVFYSGAITIEKTTTLKAIAIKEGADNSGILTVTYIIIHEVTSITGVPTSGSVGTLSLTGTVNPSTATNKEIIWSIVSAGGTGASIDGNNLKTTSAGTVMVRATIINGMATGNYIEDFSITIVVVPLSTLIVGNWSSSGSSSGQQLYISSNSFQISGYTSFSYSINGDVITFTYGGSTYGSATINIKGNVMTLSNKTGLAGSQFSSDTYYKL